MTFYIGRNGGHLTAVTFKYFREFQEAYGTEQTIRSLKLENHTVQTLLDLIKLYNLADAIDLVEWGHNELFITEKEALDAELDLISTRDAEVDVTNIKKISKEQVAEVRILTLAFLSLKTCDRTTGQHSRFSVPQVTISGPLSS
jgi:hypothetical protein